MADDPAKQDEPVVQQDGTYLTKDEKLLVVEDGKPARQYDVGGLGWLFDLFSE